MKPWREEGRMKNGESAYMVRVARERAELTHAELAERLGMSEAELSAIEAGGSVDQTLARRLSKELDVDYRVFLAPSVGTG